MKNMPIHLSVLILSIAFLLPGKLAATSDEAVFSQAELDQMLAPIALYPDTLLAQILIASTYPLEVVQAARWQRDHPGLEGVALVDQAAAMGWDPSVQSLTAFPQVLSRMDEELEWTQRLGEAFLQQEEQVMDTIQGLRERAYVAGTLQQQEHIRVQREREIIIIEPANPQIIYVPYYQPTVVYGAWWWPAYPAVYWAPPVPSRGFHFGFYWGSGIWVSSGFYYSAWDWPRRQVVVNVNHYHYGKRHYGTPAYPGSRAARWQHSAVHRRGAVYRSEHLNQRYGRTFVSTRPARGAGRAGGEAAQRSDLRSRTFTPQVRTVENVRSTLADRRAYNGSRENRETARPVRERNGREDSQVNRERREIRSGEVERRETVRSREIRNRETTRVSPEANPRQQFRRQNTENAVRTRSASEERRTVRRPAMEYSRSERGGAPGRRQEQSVRRERVEQAERRGAVNRVESSRPAPEQRGERDRNASPR